MNYFIPPYHERVEDPRDYQDYFERNEVAQNIIIILKNTDRPLTFTINADLGEGKTTFLKMWKSELSRDESFIPVYFDASENDFASDAFVTMAVSIQEAIKEYYDKHDPDTNQEKIFESYKEKAVELGLNLGKIGARRVNKLANVGLIEIKGTIESVSNIAEELDKRSRFALDDDKYDAMVHLKESLKEYHQEIIQLLGENKEESNEKKVLFFIDELDQSRPDFAFQVIELIKHIFNVPGVSFVLAINRDQLVQIIEKGYNLDNREDALLFLHKFIDIETHLKTLKEFRPGHFDNVQKYIENLVEEYDFDLFDSEGFLKILKLTKAHWEYTPRTIERIFTLYAVSLDHSQKKQRKKLHQKILLLSILKTLAPRTYEEVKKQGTLRNTLYNQNDWVPLNSLIDYIAKGVFIPEDQIKKDNTNSLEIEGLTEAADIVDIYELPSERFRPDPPFQENKHSTMQN